MTDDKRVEEKSWYSFLIFTDILDFEENTRARREFFVTVFIVPEIFTLYI